MLRLDGQPSTPFGNATLGFQLSTGDIGQRLAMRQPVPAPCLQQGQCSIAQPRAWLWAYSNAVVADLCTAVLLQTPDDKLDRIIEDIRPGAHPYQLLVHNSTRRGRRCPRLKIRRRRERTAEENRSRRTSSSGRYRRLLAELLAGANRSWPTWHSKCTMPASVQIRQIARVLTDSRFADEKMLIFTDMRPWTSWCAVLAAWATRTYRPNRRHAYETPGADKALPPAGRGRRGSTHGLHRCRRRRRKPPVLLDHGQLRHPGIRRLEQRMGRIHRYGQKHDPVCIVNLVAPATREGSVLKTLLDKLEKIRKQLKSDKVFDSIGRVFAGVSLKDYMERALQDGAETVTKELDGQLTKEQVTAIEERERRLFGDGGDVKKELPRLREGIEHESFFRLLPGYVRHFVASAAPFVGLEVDGDPGATFQLLPARKGAADPLFEAMDSYPSDMPRRLSVQRPAIRRPASDAPGEQVFECFRNGAPAPGPMR